VGCDLNGGYPLNRVFKELPMSLSPIRYLSFDCYGTLVNFRVGDVTRDRLAERVSPERMAAFLEDFTAYRFDEVLGAWKPYPEVLHRALERTCRCWGVAFDPTDAQAIVDAVPSWGPHPDVPAALAKVAEILPLVIL
jgi:2-haloacid dehalogenase